MALDAQGWTIIPTAGGRTIYVSSSTGNDANSGLSEGSPKATVQAGLNLMRDNQPDWLFLKRGDTFNIDATARYDRNGGPNASAMSVITAYGTGPRPVLLYDKLWHGSGSSGPKNLAIVSLDFYNPRNDPTSGEFNPTPEYSLGFQISESGAAATGAGNILLEDIRCRYHGSNAQCYGEQPASRIQGVTVRRCVFDEGLEFGMLINYCNDVLFEENCFSYNGWYERTVQHQGLYATGCTNITFRNNLFHRNGNMSIKLSSNYEESVSNFLEEDNVFSRGMRGYGGADYYPERWDPSFQFSHSDGITRRNVFLHTEKDFPPGSGSYQSFGLNISNMKNWLVQDNCFIHNDENLSGGIIFSFADNTEDPFPISQDITAINNIVHNWQSSWFNNTGSYIANIGGVTNFVQTNNLVTHDSSYYPDATRDLGKYNLYLGGTDDEDDLVDIARAMDKSNWDNRYTGGRIASWIRRGFIPSAETILIKSGGLYFAVSQS